MSMPRILSSLMNVFKNSCSQSVSGSVRPKDFKRLLREQCPKLLFLKFTKTQKAIGATFLNGEHYLVDAIGNLLKVNEDDSSATFTATRRKRM